MSLPTRPISAALRAVALVEATKGILVLLVGCGLLALLQKDIERYAELLIAHLHLNAAKGYPHVFLDLAARINDTHLWLLAAAALLYSLVRFIESYGLWFARRWAEWFAALSCCIYIPFEVRGLVQEVSPLTLGALVLNLVIVFFMFLVLVKKIRS